MQEQLRPLVRVRGGPRRIRLVAGADAAYRADGRWAWAAAALLALPSLAVVESAWASGPVVFPYVPGYLAFREGRLLVAALRNLRRRPDLCLFDGQGLAHPRRFGLACHLGVLLGLPSIGCAKSVLGGTYVEPGPARGAWSRIVLDGDPVGAAVRTRAGVKPVFVSPGHAIGLPAAVRWVLACATRRVPEPIRRAEQLANALRRDSAPAAGASVRRAE